MDKKKALRITRDRIESLALFVAESESEERVYRETLEYLKFVEEILRGSL